MDQRFELLVPFALLSIVQRPCFSTATYVLSPHDVQSSTLFVYDYIRRIRNFDFDLGSKVDFQDIYTYILTHTLPSLHMLLVRWFS